jgi:hypothetical protein
MTYQYIKANTLEDEYGHRVEILGRTGIRYSYQGRCIWVDAEMLGGEYGFALYTRDQRLENPKTEDDHLLETEKLEASREITSALADVGVAVEVK